MQISHQLTRVEPNLPVGAYRTFQIAAPLTTHWRKATCGEAECDAYRQGWRTIVPTDSPQAEYIRHDRSRRHVETRPGAGLACFTFEPGQQGFGHDHRLRIGRQERFVVRGGDFRGNPTGERREHKRPGDWVDEFSSNQDKLATILERG